MKRIKEILALGSLVAALGTTSIGCSNENDAINAAKSEGWSDVKVVDSDYFWTLTCDNGEMAYRMTGKNPAGKSAEATICCGYTNLKGCTLRH